jgi:peptidoglycan/xylan/chitin deacetylase (PgdA/CDA1 family)
VNILHLLSQNHLTGSEVYATTLAELQVLAKHNVHQISNGFFTPTVAKQSTLEVETKSKFTFFKNAFWLRNYILQNNIQVVHSHSRASAKLAFYATLFSNTAHVSTVHGVQHASFSKKLFNQYGQFTICVCENLKKHLMTDFGYKSVRMKTVPNPISKSLYQFIAPPNDVKNFFNIGIIGRTTGPKGTRTELVIKEILKLGTNYKISVIGGKLQDLNLSDSEKAQVIEIPDAKLNSAFYRKYDLIVGSGRVCMESLLTGVPSLAFGESKYVGLITLENFEQGLSSNFGDIHPDSKTPNIDALEFKSDIEKFSKLNNEYLKPLAELASKSFDQNWISQQIERLYESAYFLKNYSSWIPILMYHKIPQAEIKSQHKIFVTAENFEKHLQFFKKKGFTTLTFSELSLFRKGELNFKHFPKKPLVLTFDDGYRDNLETASPLLKKYGFKAQLFLLADNRINSNVWDLNGDEPAHEIMSSKERQVWKTSAYEIGSHGFRHQKITELSEEEAQKELSNSKLVLENEFKIPVQSFAFTYGVTRPEGAEMAQRAGYEYALNTDTGGMLMEEDPYSIFRVNIFPNETTSSLSKKTSKWYRRYYKFKRNK